MSETKEQYHFKPAVVQIKSLDQVMFDAYLEEEYKRGRQDALEEACKADCVFCKEGKEVELDKELGFVHVREDGMPFTHCNAKAIRKLMEASK